MANLLLNLSEYMSKCDERNRIGFLIVAVVRLCSVDAISWSSTEEFQPVSDSESMAVGRRHNVLTAHA